MTLDKARPVRLQPGMYALGVAMFAMNTLAHLTQPRRQP
jgi:hypothetical protein